MTDTEETPTKFATEAITLIDQILNNTIPYQISTLRKIRNRLASGDVLAGDRLYEMKDLKMFKQHFPELFKVFDDIDSERDV